LKGNRENPEIMALHERVLADNNASWDAPPPGSATWPDDLARRRDEIVAGYGGVPLWGFKDPRTLVLLEGWREALPRLEPAGIFRHPAAVARSLIARDRRRFDWSSALGLWRVYNQRLLLEFERKPFPLIEFVNMPARLAESLVRVCAALDLPHPECADDFFDAQLQKQAPEEAEVDDKSAALYARLREYEKEFKRSFP